MFLVLSTFPMMIKYLEKVLSWIKNVNFIKKMPVSKVESFLKSNYDLNQICKIVLTLQHLVHLFCRVPFFQSAFSGCFGIFCLSKVSLFQLKIIITIFFIRFAQSKIVIMASVTVFYINGHTSLLPNIFQIKTEEAHSELFSASEVELFVRMVNYLKPLIFFAKIITVRYNKVIKFTQV